MLWMCNNKTEEKWIVSFCSCSLRYHISTFPDDKKSLWDHQCLLPHRHSSGWGCERQWSTEKGAEVLWCCLSFISHCSNFLWMNIWWSLRLEVGGLNSGFWLIPLVSPAIVVCTVDSKVKGPFVTTDWLLMWSLTSCMHQGYSVYFNNWYTLPTLLHALKEKKVSATRTLRTKVLY